jgi:hypothetical protein
MPGFVPIGPDSGSKLERCKALIRKLEFEPLPPTAEGVDLRERVRSSPVGLRPRAGEVFGVGFDGASVIEHPLAEE